MSADRLMIHRAFVLEFVEKPTKDMDVRRVFRRRTVTSPETGLPVKDVVACRFSQLSSTELVLAYQRGSEVTHRVYFTANPNVREENRLEFNGLQYILLGVPMNASQADKLWTLDVKMVTHQNETAEVIE